MGKGFRFLGIFIIGLMCWTPPVAGGQRPATTLSFDGTPISYQATGAGSPCLVFIHGWSCDARYWQHQWAHFAKTHRVVTLDLAGHGHSGMGRTAYTMEGFGRDVRAVVKALGDPRVILVGHSMGGDVAARAARHMPDLVLGIIGIDTLENVEYPVTPEMKQQMLAPLKVDYPSGCRAFLEPMISPGTDADLARWIRADMASAPPRVAVDAISHYFDDYISGASVRAFEGLDIPVFVVKGDAQPDNPEANRRHMASYDRVVLPGADHSPMMNQPRACNTAMEKVIGQWIGN